MGDYIVNDNPGITLNINGKKRYAEAVWNPKKQQYLTLLPAEELIDGSSPANGDAPDVQGHLATFDKDGKLLGVEALGWGPEGGFYGVKWPTPADSVYNANAAKTYAPQVFKQVKRQENGGNMNYSQYLQEGGAAPQQDAQDVQQQIIALVQAAMSGDKDAADQINQIMQAAQQGDQQATQIAGLIQEVAQQMQGGAEAMKCGGKVKAKVKKKEVGGFVKKAGTGCACQLKKVGGRLIEVDGCTGLPVKRNGGNLIPFGKNTIPYGIQKQDGGNGYFFSVGNKKYYIKPGQSLAQAREVTEIDGKKNHYTVTNNVYTNGLTQDQYNNISSYLNYNFYKDKNAGITPEYNENFNYWYRTDPDGKNPTYEVQDKKNHIMYRNGKAYKVDSRGNVGEEIKDFDASNWDYNNGRLKEATGGGTQYTVGQAGTGENAGKVWNGNAWAKQTYGQENAARVGMTNDDGTGWNADRRKEWMNSDEGKAYLASINNGQGLGFTTDQYTGTAAQNRALFEAYRGYSAWKAEKDAAAAAAADPNANKQQMRDVSYTNQQLLDMADDDPRLLANPQLKAARDKAKSQYRTMQNYDQTYQVIQRNNNDMLSKQNSATMDFAMRGAAHDKLARGRFDDSLATLNKVNIFDMDDAARRDYFKRLKYPERLRQERLYNAQVAARNKYSTIDQMSASEHQDYMNRIFDANAVGYTGQEPITAQKYGGILNYQNYINF